jgi:hypothetical protein
MTAPSRGLIAAGATFAAAAIILAGALLRATAEPPLKLELAPAELAGEPTFITDEAMAMDAMAEVLDADPFQPDRQRPPSRYRLPGDVDPPPPPPPPPPPAIPDFRVAGTAVTADGGVAMMRVGDGVTRVLAPGDFLAGYQLHRIHEEGVVMRNDEREVSVTVPGPSARSAAAAPAPARGAPQQQNRAQQQGRQQQLTPEQARRMAEILERARSDGATTQMLQAIQQLIQQRGMDSFMNMDIIIDGGTMRTMQRRPPGGGEEESN